MDELPGLEKSVAGTATPWEDYFRDHLQRMREKSGMTQTDLARLLRDDYGLAFHQQTVQRIESGERPVRLNEAMAVSEVFKQKIGTLVSPPTELTEALHLLLQAKQEWRGLYFDLQKREEEVRQLRQMTERAEEKKNQANLLYTQQVEAQRLAGRVPDGIGHEEALR